MCWSRATQLNVASWGESTNPCTCTLTTHISRPARRCPCGDCSSGSPGQPWSRLWGHPHRWGPSQRLAQLITNPWETWPQIRSTWERVTGFVKALVVAKEYYKTTWLKGKVNSASLFFACWNNRLNPWACGLESILPYVYFYNYMHVADTFRKQWEANERINF